MTDEEFRKQYHRLESAFPEFYSNNTRKSAIYWQIIKYNFNFISNKISEIIKSGNPDFDFKELDSAFHKKSIPQVISKTEESVLTEGFLENHLKNLGVNSLIDLLKQEEF